MPSSSDRRELEDELDENDDLGSPRAGPMDVPRAVADLAGSVLTTSDVSAQQLAIRVAELEARLARASADGPVDPDGAGETIRELSERAKILEAQLEAARVRESELLGNTVHSDALLADVGVRLTMFGQAADRVDELEHQHAEALVQMEALTRSEADARADVEKVGARLAEIEREHAEAIARVEAASEAEANARAEVDKLGSRVAELEGEATAAGSRVADLEREHADALARLASLTESEANARAEFENVAPRGADLERQLAESLAKEQVGVAQLEAG